MGHWREFGQLSPADSAAATVLGKTYGRCLAFVVSLVVSATVRHRDGTGLPLAHIGGQSIGGRHRN
jgi:hypothetical protein